MEKKSNRQVGFKSGKLQVVIKTDVSTVDGPAETKETSNGGQSRQRKPSTNGNVTSTTDNVDHIKLTNGSHRVEKDCEITRHNQIQYIRDVNADIQLSQNERKKEMETARKGNKKAISNVSRANSKTILEDKDSKSRDENTSDGDGAKSKISDMVNEIEIMPEKIVPEKKVESLEKSTAYQVSTNGKSHTYSIEVVEHLFHSKESWFYIDPSGKLQGPFTTTQMLRWYDKGYFHDKFLPLFGTDDSEPPPWNVFKSFSSQLLASKTQLVGKK